MENIKISILVVGTGGTGTALLSTLTQVLANRNDEMISLGVCDGDIVEKKNLARQAFDESQIGLNKAQAIAETIEEARGLSVKVFTTFLEDVDAIERAFYELDSGGHFSTHKLHVLVSCVDNLKARSVFEEWFRKEKSCCYLDSANEEFHGEVVYAVKNLGKVFSPPRSVVFPSFKKLLKKEAKSLQFRSEMDCLQRSISSPQHISTNKQAGLLLATALTRLIEKSDIPKGVDFFSVFPEYFVRHEDTSMLAELNEGGESNGKTSKNRKVRGSSKAHG